jgi:TRAP-type uncharacterized transport system fused permease subunit
MSFLYSVFIFFSNHCSLFEAEQNLDIVGTKIYFHTVHREFILRAAFTVLPISRTKQTTKRKENVPAPGFFKMIIASFNALYFVFHTGSIQIFSKHRHVSINLPLRRGPPTQLLKT